MKNLRQKVLSGISWRTTVNIGEQILLILFTAVLARILSRSDFGLVAMGLMATRFIVSVTQIGFGTAVIQSQNITKEQTSAIFILQIGLHAIIYLICCLFAPLAASFFKEDDLVLLIRVLSVSMLFDALSFPNILLQKEIRYRENSLLELFCMITANIFAITFAIFGYGVWSLVYRLLIHKFLFALFIWFLSDWRLCKPKFQGISTLVRFGFNMLGHKICLYFSQNMIGIFLGKYFGADILGSYNIAYNIALVPAQKMKNVIGVVLLSAFSRAGVDESNIIKKLQTVLFSLSLFFVPAMVGLSAISRDLVYLIYGPKWTDAGIFLAFLAFVGLFKGIGNIFETVLLAMGLSFTNFILTLIDLMGGIIILYLAYISFGLPGVLTGFIVITFVSFMLKLLFVESKLKTKFIFIKSTYSIILSSVIMFIVLTMFKFTFTFNQSVMLFTMIVLGILIYSTSFKIFSNKFHLDQLYNLPILSRLK